MSSENLLLVKLLTSSHIVPIILSFCCRFPILPEEANTKGSRTLFFIHKYQLMFQNDSSDKWFMEFDKQESLKFEVVETIITKNNVVWALTP